MRVVLVNYGHHADLRTGEALLERYHTLTGWARGLTAAGARVTVVQGFSRRERIDLEGTRYEFVAGPFAPSLPRWFIPRRLHRLIRHLRPDVVQMNGLIFPLQTRALRWSLPSAVRLVTQFRAEAPRRGLVGRVQGWGLKAVDGFIFAGREQAAPWRALQLIGAEQPVFEIVGGSNHFQMSRRSGARTRTGMAGEPILLWVGNLDANKDPLTVLSGFERALAEAPRGRLYMAFVGDQLLPQVRERLATSQLLREAVVLLGKVPYEGMEALMNSADYFVLGSHHESTGYALIEALACGTVPIVTDIPSFRAITNGGVLGALWPPGDAAALETAMGEVLSRPLEPARLSARAFFEAQLSYAAIGRQALDAYRALHAGRTR